MSASRLTRSPTRRRPSVVCCQVCGMIVTANRSACGLVDGERDAVDRYRALDRQHRRQLRRHPDHRADGSRRQARSPGSRPPRRHGRTPGGRPVRRQGAASARGSRPCPRARRPMSCAPGSRARPVRCGSALPIATTVRQMPSWASEAPRASSASGRSLATTSSRPPGISRTVASDLPRWVTMPVNMLASCAVG